MSDLSTFSTSDLQVEVQRRTQAAIDLERQLRDNFVELIHSRFVQDDPVIKAAVFRACKQSNLYLFTSSPEKFEVSLLISYVRAPREPTDV